MTSGGYSPMKPRGFGNETGPKLNGFRVVPEPAVRPSERTDSTLMRTKVPGTLVTPGDLSGVRNQNPPGLTLLELLAEDFRTHEADPTQAGFWALAVHRFGNWRMQMRPRLLRLPFSAAYRVLYHGVTLTTGIDLPYATKLGRRIRFWHHGGTVVSARAVGDDVHIRHNTTVGVARRGAPVDELPIIGNRVDIGVGAAILGPIVVADDTVIGGNAVVIRSNRPGETLVGVPARTLRSIGRDHEG